MTRGEGSLILHIAENTDIL